MEEMKFSTQDHVAILTINRPEFRNAMTWEMYDRLVELCEVVDGEDTIRVWLIRGAGGKAFNSGTDIHQFRAFMGNPRAGLEYEARLDQVFGRLAAVQKPTLALIEGFSIGGGLALALHCDLRIATPESQFGVPCVKLGNCLSMANYAKLLDRVGSARLLEWMYTGRLFPAEVALSIGLVNAVILPSEIEEYGLALANEIARGAPLAIKVTKEAVRRLTRVQAPAGDDLIQECYLSKDFQEGVAAFLEKRPPRWEGQ